MCICGKFGLYSNVCSLNIEVYVMLPTQGVHVNSYVYMICKRGVYAKPHHIDVYEKF